MANDLSAFDAPDGQATQRQVSPEDFLRQFDAPVAEPAPTKKPAAAPAQAVGSPAPAAAGAPEGTAAQLWREKDPVAGAEAAIGAAGGYAALSGLTRVINAMRGAWDPSKAEQMKTYEALRAAGIPLRIGDLTGTAETAQVMGQSPRWRSLENFTEHYVPFSGAGSMLEQQAAGLRPLISEPGGPVGGKTLDAVKKAWNAREGQLDQLWQNLDIMGQQSNLPDVVPSETVQKLKDFVSTYGPQKLASIPNKKTAATLLTLAGYPDEAASTIGHLKPGQVSYQLNRANNMVGGTNFTAFRDLQKAIGQTIGDFAGDIGKPTPPEQAAFKQIYAATHRDLDNFGADQVSADFKAAFDQARQATKETRDFYDDNNFLRKVVRGQYTMQEPQFLRDFTNPANAAKISPLAPFVQPADVTAFQAPLVVDRATRQLVSGALREPANKYAVPKALTGLAELGATTAPSIYGGWTGHSPASGALLGLAALGGQTAASNALNSRIAPRLWGAANPLELGPVAESPVLGALRQLGRLRLRMVP